MFCVSVNFTSSEWVRIQQAAGKQFPNENSSRSAISRRYALVGMEALKNISDADRARLAHQFQVSIETEDQRLRS
jgi:hypothetical protein